MTGTNCDLFTYKSSWSYLNHLVCMQGNRTIQVAFFVIFLHNSLISVFGKLCIVQ
jgi:hypothetical protein